VKVCKRCQRGKDGLEFYLNHRTKDGLDIYCKECKKEMNRGYIEKPGVREKKNLYNRNYKAKHPRSRWNKEVIHKRIEKKTEQIKKLLAEIKDLKSHLQE
jgi:hypothetical protein